MTIDDIEELGSDGRLRNRSIQQRLHRSLDEREGRAQLVTDIGHEFAAGALQLAEAGRIVQNHQDPIRPPFGPNKSDRVDLK